jgi:hypothetical protein
VDALPAPARLDSAVLGFEAWKQHPSCLRLGQIEGCAVPHKASVDAGDAVTAGVDDAVRADCDVNLAPVPAAGRPAAVVHGR